MKRVADRAPGRRGRYAERDLLRFVARGARLRVTNRKRARVTRLLRVCRAGRRFARDLVSGRFVGAFYRHVVGIIRVVGSRVARRCRRRNDHRRRAVFLRRLLRHRKPTRDGKKQRGGNTHSRHTFDAFHSILPAFFPDSSSQARIQRTRSARPLPANSPRAAKARAPAHPPCNPEAANNAPEVKLRLSLNRAGAISWKC